jgi:hypothetical protein
MVSTTDPDAIWATKGSGTAKMAYYDSRPRADSIEPQRAGMF